MVKIIALFKAFPSPLEKNSSIISSINRLEANELIVLMDRVEGDDVYNKTHHGGPQRVLHHYPLEHLEYWNQYYLSKAFLPGSMGENISTYGLTENNVCIGDIFKIGDIVCQVTEPRKPCVTINHQFGMKGLARKVQEESKTGWFYKVLKAGTLKKGDEIILHERLFPELTIGKCVQGLLVNRTPEILQMIANNPVISYNWKKPARELLNGSKTSNDESRLGD